MKLSEIGRASDLADIVLNLKQREANCGFINISCLKGTTYPEFAIPMRLSSEIVDLIEKYAIEHLDRLGVK